MSSLISFDEEGASLLNIKLPSILENYLLVLRSFSHM